MGTIKRLRDEWKKQGKCASCGKNPARPGRTKCQECANRNTTYRRERRQRHRAAGLCTDCGQPATKKRCERCAEVSNANARLNHRRLKLVVMIHYSTDPPMCACCKESELDFLTINHIDGGGNKHYRSKEVSSTCGNNIYRWLRKHKFQPGFNVLCLNCNFAIGAYGICPHKRVGGG